MTELEQLQETIIACTKCPRLVPYLAEVARTKRRMYMDWDYWGKPLPGYGDSQARMLVMGRAPAAHGGNRTGRMCTGDRSGDWVFGTLHKYGFSSSPDSKHRDDGLTLHDAYITNALRCAPPGNKPLREEKLECLPYLVRELELMDTVQVVVALGKIAFDTYLTTFAPRGLNLPKPLPKFGHLVTYPLDGGVILVGSYHPSQQNTQTGRLTHKMFDAVFAKAKELLN